MAYALATISLTPPLPPSSYKDLAVPVKQEAIFKA